MKSIGAQLWQLVVFASFSLFIAGKVTSVFAAWSWWWLFLTPVPVFSYFMGWA